MRVSVRAVCVCVCVRHSVSVCADVGVCVMCVCVSVFMCARVRARCRALSLFENGAPQVHSLHHRNTDIEPFAGLCMHPVEHLCVAPRVSCLAVCYARRRLRAGRYYFAAVCVSLSFYCSPFTFLWNGVHLLLAPAAGHSGFEDHWQARRCVRLLGWLLALSDTCG